MSEARCALSRDRVGIYSPSFLHIIAPHSHRPVAAHSRFARHACVVAHSCFAFVPRLFPFRRVHYRASRAAETASVLSAARRSLEALGYAGPQGEDSDASDSDSAVDSAGSGEMGAIACQCKAKASTEKSKSTVPSISGNAGAAKAFCRYFSAASGAALYGIMRRVLCRGRRAVRKAERWHRAFENGGNQNGRGGLAHVKKDGRKTRDVSGRHLSSSSTTLSSDMSSVSPGAVAASVSSSSSSFPSSSASPSDSLHPDKCRDTLSDSDCESTTSIEIL